MLGHPLLRPLSPEERRECILLQGKAAYCATQKATARLFDEKKHGMSRDDEVKGGKEGSKPNPAPLIG